LVVSVCGTRDFVVSHSHWILCKQSVAKNNNYPN